MLALGPEGDRPVGGRLDHHEPHARVVDQPGHQRREPLGQLLARQPVVLARDVDEPQVARAEHEELVGAGAAASSAGSVDGGPELAGARSFGELAGTQPVRRLRSRARPRTVALLPAEAAKAFTRPAPSESASVAAVTWASASRPTSVARSSP